MPKQIIGEAFETLKSQAQHTGQQAKQAAGGVARQSVSSLLDSPTTNIEKGAPSAQKTVKPTQTRDAVDTQTAQIAKMKQLDDRQKLARYREIQKELELLRKKRAQEVPKYISGKAGFSEEDYRRQQIGLPTNKEQKEQEKQSGGLFGRLWSATRSKRPGLPFFAKQKQGTGEVRLGKQG